MKVGGAVENSTTKWYTLCLMDKLGNGIAINVIGLEKISSSIESVNVLHQSNTYYYLKIDMVLC